MLGKEKNGMVKMSLRMRDLERILSQNVDIIKIINGIQNTKTVSINLI